MKKLFLRIIFTLILVLALVAYATLPFVEGLIHTWFARDLDLRANLVAQSLQETLPLIMEKNSKASRERLSKYFYSFAKDGRIYGLVYCSPEGEKLVDSTPYGFSERCPRASEVRGASSHFAAGRSSYVSVIPLLVSQPPGTLLVVQDVTYMRARSQTTQKYMFYLFVILAFVIALITIAVAYLSWRGWLKSIRGLLRGENIFKDLRLAKASSELRPVIGDFRNFLRDFENQIIYHHDFQAEWSPNKLKDILRSELRGEDILVVANREPYIHIKENGKITVANPASGLVSALEPVLRACSGTWIAHGSGSGDRAVVDENDRIKVPPEKPSYFIRRVWLSAAEEKGYYFGFANEGLWPLCHIAHTRPLFRSEDWEAYKKVNQRFADIVVEEAKSDTPVILVQDYHFALLPRMVREKLPKATIISFWHIPWPNPESFGICPWREEILQGMLGSTILGFHTRFHSNNFLETVDRYLECRIDKETSVVSYKTQLCAVRNYPISIEWPPRWVEQLPSIEECSRLWREKLSLPLHHKIVVSVDRLDYTKGILEKFYSIERLLEKHPEWVGAMSFVQIAAPSRTRILRYREFDREVEDLAQSINERFSRNGIAPILLLKEHHDPNEVYSIYRAADVCYVGSLHDGMNLVAKEYVAARDDEIGSLVLSTFAGASRELLEALMVNPYNFDECAEALHYALNMNEKEKRARMRSMRETVKFNNVYRWAGKMLLDASLFKKRQKIHENVLEWRPSRSKLFLS
jgi:trehalose-6-phosphate synthase